MSTPRFEDVSGDTSRSVDTLPCPPPDGCEDEDSYWTMIDRQFAEQYDTDRAPEIPPPPLRSRSVLVTVSTVSIGSLFPCQ